MVSLHSIRNSSFDYNPHWRQSFFWYGFAILLVRSFKVGRGRIHHESVTHKYADNERNKRQRGHAEAPTSLLMERHWVLDTHQQHNMHNCSEQHLQLRREDREFHR